LCKSPVCPSNKKNVTAGKHKGKRKRLLRQLECSELRHKGDEVSSVRSGGGSDKKKGPISESKKKANQNSREKGEETKKGKRVPVCACRPEKRGSSRSSSKNEKGGRRGGGKPAPLRPSHLGEGSGGARSRRNRRE